MIYSNSNQLCKEAEQYYYDFIGEESHSLVPANIIEHIEQCSYCQEQLEQLKKTLSQAQTPDFQQQQTRASVLDILEHQLSYIAKPVTCNIVKPFLPSLSEMALELEVPTPITVHLDNCSQCRKDLKAIRKLNLSSDQLNQLSRFFSEESAEERQNILKNLSEHEQQLEFNKTIFAIADRPNSPVSTVYTVNKSLNADSTGELDNPYAGFPINIEVITDEAERSDIPVEIFKPAVSKGRTINFKPLLKAALAAAAVVMIGFMFFHTSTARATTLQQICRAIEKIKNVYITKFNADQTRSDQELWVSKSLNIYMIKTAKETVLWDLSNQTRKIKSAENGVTETTAVTKETLAGIEKKTGGYLGLIPFYELSQIPADSQWNRIKLENPDISQGLEVYDLTWRDSNSNGSFQFWKWRLFIDPKTELPQRTECYLKVTAAEEYKLQSVNVIEYPSDSQIQDVLNSVFL